MRGLTGFHSRSLLSVPGQRVRPPRSRNRSACLRSQGPSDLAKDVFWRSVVNDDNMHITACCALPRTGELVLGYNNGGVYTFHLQASRRFELRPMHLLDSAPIFWVGRPEKYGAALPSKMQAAPLRLTCTSLPGLRTGCRRRSCSSTGPCTRTTQRSSSRPPSFLWSPSSRTTGRRQ